MGKGGQIWLKCITVYLIMMIRDKNNIFERVENFHADLAWNYPGGWLYVYVAECTEHVGASSKETVGVKRLLCIGSLI